MDSLMHRPGLLGFAWRRLVRLLPGLAVCVLLTATVLGSLATTLPFRAYALNGMTRHYLSNIVLVPSLWLPGVFQGQQWSGTVNPMLWTLGAGMVLWILIAVISRLPPNWRLAALALGAVLCLTITLLAPDPSGHPLRTRLMEIAVEAPFFLLAAFYRQIEERRADIWRADVALLLFAANWVSATWLGEGNYVLEAISLPYMALAFGRMSAPVLGQLGRLGNPSYGFYLYAFPLQQLIVARWPGFPHPILACGALALMAGFLSWHLVERPALAWAGRHHSWPWPASRQPAMTGPR